MRLGAPQEQTVPKRFPQSVLGGIGVEYASSYRMRPASDNSHIVREAIYEGALDGNERFRSSRIWSVQGPLMLDG